MKASVEKYGGFYIGRYEAGKEGTDTYTAVSKKGATVWSNISFDSTWTETSGGYGKDTNDGAAKLSKAKYFDSVRHLIYGVQWDAAVTFIDEGKHYNILNCETWGNFKNYNASVDESKKVAGAGSLKTAGYSEHWKAKNIYDLAGNVLEWTYETTKYNDGGDRCMRGASYASNADNIWYSVCSRFFACLSDSTQENYGFRFALYLK